MYIRYLQGNTVEIESEKNILVMETENGSEQANILTCSQEKKFAKSANTVLTWPGEYERCGWLIKGIESDDDEAVIFAANIENMTIVHLGKAKTIPARFFDTIENIDVLILPVESQGRSVEEAKKINQSVEARIIIPVGDLALNFAEASGVSTQALPKAKISKSELPIDKTEIIPLMGA